MKKKVSFVSLKEKVDTSTPFGKFVVTVFVGLAELEREYIRARQAEGIAAAKKEGKYKGRPAKVYDKKKFKEAVALVRLGEKSATEAIKEFKAIPTTYYRWVKG